MGSITKLRHPPARIQANDIHGLCLSRCGVAGIPPVDPRDILYEDMYKHHGSAQVTDSERGYQPSTYWGSEGGSLRVPLLAAGDNGVLSYAYIRACTSVWGEPGVGSRYLWHVRCIR